MTDLRHLVEAERQRFRAPGLAIAVVRDGETLLCEGFGLADVDAGVAVTAHTPLAIASNTKAFTASALCLLAAEGRIDLDAPVRSYLPWFALRDLHASELVTTRDLLTHRTGLAGHDLVRAGESGLDLAGLTRVLRHLEPAAPVRQTWIYSNLGYEAAAHVTEVVAGRAWRDVIRERLLGPLGMTSTGFSVWADDVAVPYGETDGRPTPLVRAPDTQLGAAGGLVASADDLSRWLLARLGHGLPEPVLEELHRPAVTTGAAALTLPGRLKMGYALGCHVEAYRGHRLVSHGGSDLGWTSSVMVAPDDGIGIGVLTNANLCYVTESLPLQILDRLLGLEPGPWGDTYLGLMQSLLREAGEATARQAETARRRPGLLTPSECAGSYRHPAYGTFTVLPAGDGLAPNFHGYGDELVLRHRDRDVWDLVFAAGPVTWPVNFRTGPDGDVSSLSVPFEPAVNPIVFERQP